MIPQSNPKAGYETRRAEINAALARVLDSGWYILGTEVRAFEQEFAAFIGPDRHAVGVASGTDALQLALRAGGVGPGDAVLTVSHTAVATVTAIVLCGAAPVFVDIDPATFTLDPNCLEETLRERDRRGLTRPKAVVPVHLYGHPADMTAIGEIARRHELLIVEDCAQSHGARRQGRMTGAWGDLAAFSFYPTKNLGALGDGGLVVTGDAGLAEQVRLLRQYGWSTRYVSAIPGDNSRLDEMQAAILRVKLPTLNADNARRRDIARHYQTLLTGAELALPETATDIEHVFHQYVVRSPARDKLRDFLQVNGVGTTIHYPVPVHHQPAYTRFADGCALPRTDAAAASVLSLPMFPELTETEAETVAHTILAQIPAS